MPRYSVVHTYRAKTAAGPIGPFHAGTEVELEADLADWVNRDCPGTLTEVVPPAPAVEPEPAPEPEAPAEEPEEPAETERDATPTKDRMHRGGRRRAT